MSENSLRTILLNLRRRMLAAGASAGFAWGLAGAVSLLIVCMWLDLMFEMPPVVRIFSVVLAIVAGGGLIFAAIAAAMRLSGPRQLAQRLDIAAGTGGQILSGVDLALSSSHQAKTITQGLAELAVDRAHTIAAKVDPKLALTFGHVRRALTVLAVLLACVGVVAIISPRLVRTQWLRFGDPFGDHPPFSWITLGVEPGDVKVVYGSGVDIIAQPSKPVDRVELVMEGGEKLPMFPQSDGNWRATIASVTSAGHYLARAGSSRSKQFDIDVITVPKIENVTFRVTLPAYTHRPPIEGPLPQGGLAGLPGTTVEVRAKSNRPLSGGRIEFAGAAINMTAQDNEAVGSFTINQAGKVSINVTDVAGQSATDPFSASVTLLADERPFVRIIEPPAISYATPDVTLPVATLSEDDWGVSRVELYRGLNDSRARGTEIVTPDPPSTKVNAATQLHLSEYGLVPGDVLKLFARAEDNDPTGAKGSESSVVIVQIISKEQMQEMLLAREGMDVLQSKYEQAARRMEALDAQLEEAMKELEKFDPNSSLGKEQQEKLQKLAEQFEKEAKAVEELADHDLPFDLDKALSKNLRDAAMKIGKAGKNVGELASKQSLGAAGAMDELKKVREQLGADRKQFQKDTTEPLEHLAKILPLFEDQARFVELYQRQRELEQRMTSIRDANGKDDPKTKARMREMEDQQRKIAQDLRDLLDDIDNHVAELPADAKMDPLRKTATEFAKAVRNSAAGDAMSKAQTALSDFDGSGAWASAKDSANILESFLSKCSGMGNEAGVCLRFQPKLAQALGNSVQQLLEGMGMGGMGSGRGGYSARRNSLANVGLYGSLPTRSAAGSSGGKANRSIGRRSTGEPDADANPQDSAQTGKTSGAGEGQAHVPVQYRQRTGEYFQRVSDELGK